MAVSSARGVCAHAHRSAVGAQRSRSSGGAPVSGAEASRRRRGTWSALRRDTGVATCTSAPASRSSTMTARRPWPPCSAQTRSGVQPLPSMASGSAPLASSAAATLGSPAAAARWSGDRMLGSCRLANTSSMAPWARRRTHDRSFSSLRKNWVASASSSPPAAAADDDDDDDEDDDDTTVGAKRRNATASISSMRSGNPGTARCTCADGASESASWSPTAVTASLGRRSGERGVRPAGRGGRRGGA